VRAAAADVAAAVPRASLLPHGHFVVDVTGERLTIPTRIYNDEPDGQQNDWTPTHRLVAHCLYTRHHDGRVRERHALRIVRDLTPWVLPFVVQLVGEYVVEIVAALEERLPEIGTPSSLQERAYGAFLAANPELLRLTRARVISYWDCYYRRDFPALADYPGYRLIAAFERAAEAAVKS
jgi:hypothetical protein